MQGLHRKQSRSAIISSGKRLYFKKAVSEEEDWQGHGSFSLENTLGRWREPPSEGGGRGHSAFAISQIGKEDFRKTTQMILDAYPEIWGMQCPIPHSSHLLTLRAAEGRDWTRNLILFDLISSPSACQLSSIWNCYNTWDHWGRMHPSGLVDS